jgi:transposase-like protein
MGRNRSDEFRKDAVRIALTSGLTCRQFADDLGIGMSTLNKWITAHRDTDVVSADDRALPRVASCTATEAVKIVHMIIRK